MTFAVFFSFEVFLNMKDKQNKIRDESKEASFRTRAITRKSSLTVTGSNGQMTSNLLPNIISSVWKYLEQDIFSKH